MAKINNKEKKYIRKCPNCNNDIFHKDSWSCTNSNKLNKFCMKCVRKNRGSIYDKTKDLNLIKVIKSIYYDLNLTLEEISKKAGISFVTLKKIIEKENLPKLKRKIKKWDRVDSYKKTYKSRYGFEYSEMLNKKSDFEKYRHVVRKLTEKNIKTIKGFLDEKKLVNRGKNKYHVDHIVSVFDGFNNNVPPFYIADISNLRMLDSKNNTSKGHRSDMDLDILIENILLTENNPILMSDLWHKISL